MSETKGLDLIGAGQVAKAIPKKAWERLTNTACKIIEETLAPVTATTGGLGRLISAKFDKLVDAEKILAANVFEKANQKIRDADVRPEVTPKPSIIVDTLEFTGLETNILLQELWSNLLVCELTTGQVHPEFPKILSRLSPNDAQLLAQIAEQVGSENAMRAVGAANGKNPISIIAPCHRVVGASGKLVGFAGGLDNKAILLKLESSTSKV